MRSLSDPLPAFLGALAPFPTRRLRVRPDFIIAGAMKCGTTSLHEALSGHPDVFIPNGEIQLFAVDDYGQHENHFACANGDWCVHDFDEYFDTYVEWHAQRHAPAPAGALIGEDAPTYLASRPAIDRIAELAPHTKLVVILRDPVDRVYSGYWHWVRTFRARLSLEDTLRFTPGHLVQRSFYEEQLTYCFEKLGSDRVHVELFEEFVRDQESVMRRILDFLGLKRVPLGPVHANAGSYSRWPSLALWRNRVVSGLYGRRYLGRIPFTPEPPPLSIADRLIVRLTGMINPAVRRPPPRDADTENFLRELLRRRNRGLSALLGVDLGRHWPTFASDEGC